jgi:glyoxylase-like metal-dependent hydrolase (beta-lactamase superfamily II)
VILPGIYAVNTGFVNMFLIKTDDGYIAIDAGVNANTVEQGMAQLGILSDDVVAVLLTHTHGDHTAALKLFGKAVIYGGKQGPADKVLADGETIEILGKEIRIISTPGHSGDSVCYLFDGVYLFTGDNMSLNGGKVELFNSFYNSSDEQQKADIDKLSRLSGVEYIITAHYGFAADPVYP